MAWHAREGVHGRKVAILRVAGNRLPVRVVTIPGTTMDACKAMDEGAGRSAGNMGELYRPV